MKPQIAQRESSSVGSFLGLVQTRNEEPLGTAVYWPKHGLELCFDVWPRHEEEVYVKAGLGLLSSSDGTIFATNPDLNVDQSVKVGAFRQEGGVCVVTLERVPNIPDCRILALVG